jgi:N-glycosylase/DNA lyase
MTSSFFFLLERERLLFFLEFEDKILFIIPILICFIRRTSSFHQRFGRIISMEKRKLGQYAGKRQDVSWIDLEISPEEMNPSNTLNMGQCFNWKKITLPGTNYWVGVLNGLPLMVKQTPRTTLVKCLNHEISDSFPMKKRKGSDSNPVASDDRANLLKNELRDYFQISSTLLPLYDHWSSRCDRMKVVTTHLQGVRVVRQEPWECLISFICSSNNNISRISLMLDRLRAKYGNYLCSVVIKNNNNIHVKEEGGVKKEDKELGGEDFFEVTFLSEKELLEKTTEPGKDQKNEIFHLYSFPTPQALSQANEEDLRGLGMGYRAKFILETSKLVVTKPTSFFEDLRALAKQSTVFSPSSTVLTVPIKEEKKAKKVKKESVQQEDQNGMIALSPQQILNRNQKLVQQMLLEFPGVGMKVADCVALFSLDCSNAIPVDVHVWNIAMRDYRVKYLSNETFLKLKEKKSLTPTIYDEIGDIFRNLFQYHSGWAHSVLFAAELPFHRKLLPQEIQLQMKEHDEVQKKLKKLLKEEIADKKKKDA